MIRLLVIILLALGVAVAIALVAAGDPGYVLISRAPWQIEVSLTLFIVVALLAGVLAYLAARFAGRLWRVPGDVAAWQRRRRLERGLRVFESGVVSLIEGDWEGAERKLAGHVVTSPSPLLSRLAAAYAAHRRGDSSQRDRYLDMICAAGDGDEHRFATRLLQARFQIQSGELDEGLATLETLRAQQPRNPQVAGLLVEVKRALRDWESLTQLVPALPRGTHTERGAEDIEREAWRALLSAADTSQRLDSVWNELAARHRHDPVLVETYARALSMEGRGEQAESVIRDTLRRHWHGGLLELYGRVQGSDKANQLATAEDWLGSHPDDPLLYLTLGRLSAANELWGKARGYFDKAIGLGGPPETYRELGALLEQLGEKELALDTYRRGLSRGSSPTLITHIDPAPV